MKPQLLEGSASGSAATTPIDRETVMMTRLRVLAQMGSGSGSATWTLQHSTASASDFVAATKGGTTIQAVVKTGSANDRVQEIEITGEDMQGLNRYLRAIVSYESGGADLYVAALAEAEGTYLPMGTDEGKLSTALTPVISTDL
jgi:hypothetical protein